MLKLQIKKFSPHLSHCHCDAVRHSEAAAAASAGRAAKHLRRWKTKRGHNATLLLLLVVDEHCGRNGRGQMGELWAYG